MSDNNAGLRQLLAVATDLVASLEACQRRDYGLDDSATGDGGSTDSDSAGMVRSTDPLDTGLDIPSL